MTRTTPALSFGAAARTYQSTRPSYPPEAVAWILGEAPRRVVDLGAGTGILTRVVRDLGHRVLPVEADPRMCAELLAGTHGTTPVAGSAERIPLRDAAVDAVVAGQAFHWFDPDRAPAEIARVLRPGGVLGPVWNIRDDAEPWVARLSEIIEGVRGADHEGAESPGDLGPAFGVPQRAEFRHRVPMTAPRLVSLVTTRSYFLTAPADRRAEVLARVNALAAELPERFELPYVTVAYRAVRLPD